MPLESTLRFVAGSHAGTWYMPRTRRTSPPFAGLADHLPDGAVMDDALFPLVGGFVCY